jgi:hypothetical protein
VFFVYAICTSLLTPAYDGRHVLLVTWRPERGADPLAYAAGSFPAVGLPVSQGGPAEDRGVWGDRRRRKVTATNKLGSIVSSHLSAIWFNAWCIQRVIFPCPKDPDLLRLIVPVLVFKPAQTRQILRKLLPNRMWVWRERRDGERVYWSKGEAAVGKLFNGLVHIERSGVPNGI